MPKSEARRKFVINAAFVGIVILLVYFIFKYLVGMLMPFIIGFLVASLLNTPVRILSKRLRLKGHFVAVCAVLVFYATAGALAGFLLVKLFVAAGELFEYLPSFYNNTVAPLLAKFFDFTEELVAKFDKTAAGGYGTIFSDVEISLGSAISALSVRVLGYISTFATNLPMLVLEVVLTVISTFFFAADYGYITNFLVSLLPCGARERLCEVKKCLFGVAVKYLRSYSLILLITFAELVLGLTLAGAENAFFAAIVISLLDILPVLGTGAVLVPWAVIEMLGGSFKKGILLLIVYAVITVVRNIIEPRIVGKEVGLHPTLTLISMFVGARLFGFVGLFGFPVGLSLLKSLDDCGQISLFNKKKSTPQ